MFLVLAVTVSRNSNNPLAKNLLVLKQVKY